MYKLKTRIDFEAAHRLYNVNTYSEECSDNLHGHSYKVDVVVGRETLNNADMVIDFKLLKERLRKCIVDKFDHSCILCINDPLAKYVNKYCKKVHIVPESPTAEYMTADFADRISSELIKIDPEVVVLSVAVHETENNIATWEKSDK